jgi:hypothetical protein
MEKKDRTKTVAVTVVLAIQLREWLTFAREMGAMNQRFKYLSGILLSSLNGLIRFMFEGQDPEQEEAYEHSVKVSDIVTELIDLTDEQQKRVLGLIKKIKAG